jgi:hypothetical protein
MSDFILTDTAEVAQRKSKYRTVMSAVIAASMLGIACRYCPLYSIHTHRFAAYI